MSAYVVEDQCINQIVSYCNRAIYGTRGMEDVRHMLRYSEFAGECWGTDSELQIMAEELQQLNIAAVMGRYEWDEGGYPPIKFSLQIHVTPHQVYKSLKSLIYQCSEGDVPETKLYKFMEDLHSAIAREIVEETDEYKAAEWA